MRTYVITETGRHSSLDPLDADATQNLPVARMVYATPLEMGLNERLVSAVLESFSYKPELREIVWEVRKGVTFDDGKEITAEDVAFAVVRMAFTRPQFPVIKEIEGVASWAGSKNALRTYPSGISVHGNSIKIKLSEPVDHPLFRFALELFSIIPKRCVDLDTNKLMCPNPPASGYYKIARTTEDGLVFERRIGFPSSVDVPKLQSLAFKYMSSAQVLAGAPGIGENFVIAGNETAFSKGEIAKIDETYIVRSLPKSRFADVSLNPRVPAFQRRECRVMFLGKFREFLLSSGMSQDEVEGAMTSRVLPGYLTLDELKKRSAPLDAKASEECEKILRKEPIEFGVWKGGRFPAAEEAISKTLHYFGKAKVDARIYESRDQHSDDFVAGACPIRLGASGFWPQDPFGDLQMLFTPNLHKARQFSAADGELQKRIEELRKPLPAMRRRERAEEFNLYVFEQGLVGVYRHTKRFFLSPKTQGRGNVPLALTSPAPWQVFD